MNKIISRRLKTTTALTSILMASIAVDNSLANPEGGKVVAGDVTITEPNPTTVQVDQFSQKAIVDWRSFNIAPNETTRFVQPNSQAWILNRINGSHNPTTIQGTLEANGNVAIVNPDGIVFSQGARIDVNSLIATTHNISNDDFMAGRMNFNIPGNPAASVINEGSISIGDHGLGAFVAPGVRNSGVITARLGNVSLAAGNKFTLDLYGDGLVNLAIDDQITHEVIDLKTGKLMSDLVKNSGTIKADGGTVALKAATARRAVNAVINNTGVIEANTIGMENGKIILGAQTAATKPLNALQQKVKVSGRLQTTALPTRVPIPKPSPRTGGDIEITGEAIELANATIDASGVNGGGAILIGGDYLGGNGDAAIIDQYNIPLAKHKVPTARFLTANAGSLIKADALENGNGGKIILWSDDTTSTAADITTKGGNLGGDGGFIETSGKQLLDVKKAADASAINGAAGTWLLDPNQISIFSPNNPYVQNLQETANQLNQTVIDPATIEASLNSGTNVDIKTRPEDPKTFIVTDPINGSSYPYSLWIYDDINKTAGGDASLTFSAFGLMQFNGSDITSTSGKLDINLNLGIHDGIDNPGMDLGLSRIIPRTYTSVSSDPAHFSSNGGNISLFGGPTISGGTFETKGGAFKAETSNYYTNAEIYLNRLSSSGYAVNTGSGDITIKVKAPTQPSATFNWERLNLTNGSLVSSGQITLDADLKGNSSIDPIVIELENSYQSAVNDGNPEVYTNNPIIAVGSTDISIIEVAKFSDFTPTAPVTPTTPVTPITYTPKPVSGASLPTGNYVIGERIDIPLPTLFSVDGGSIVSQTVSRPTDGDFQIITVNGQKRLVGTYNGNPGTINLTFEAISDTQKSAQLSLPITFTTANVVTPTPTVITSQKEEIQEEVTLVENPENRVKIPVRPIGKPVSTFPIEYLPYAGKLSDIKSEAESDALHKNKSWQDLMDGDTQIASGIEFKIVGSELGQEKSINFNQVIPALRSMSAAKSVNDVMFEAYSARFRTLMNDPNIQPWQKDNIRIIHKQMVADYIATASEVQYDQKSLTLARRFAINFGNWNEFLTKPQTLGAVGGIISGAWNQARAQTQAFNKAENLFDLPNVDQAAAARQRIGKIFKGAQSLSTTVNAVDNLSSEEGLNEFGKDPIENSAKFLTDTLSGNVSLLISSVPDTADDSKYIDAMSKITNGGGKIMEGSVDIYNTFRSSPNKIAFMENPATLESMEKIFSGVLKTYQGITKFRELGGNKNLASTQKFNALDQAIVDFESSLRDLVEYKIIARKKLEDANRVNRSLDELDFGELGQTIVASTKSNTDIELYQKYAKSMRAVSTAVGEIFANDAQGIGKTVTGFVSLLESGGQSVGNTIIDVNSAEIRENLAEINSRTSVLKKQQDHMVSSMEKIDNVLGLQRISKTQ